MGKMSTPVRRVMAQLAKFSEAEVKAANDVSKYIERHSATLAILGDEFAVQRVAHLVAQCRPDDTPGTISNQTLTDSVIDIIRIRRKC